MGRSGHAQRAPGRAGRARGAHLQQQRVQLVGMRALELAELHRGGAARGRRRARCGGVRGERGAGGAHRRAAPAGARGGSWRQMRAECAAHAYKPARPRPAAPAVRTAAHAPGSGRVAAAARPLRTRGGATHRLGRGAGRGARGRQQGRGVRPVHRRSRRRALRPRAQRQGGGAPAPLTLSARWRRRLRFVARARRPRRPPRGSGWRRWRRDSHGLQPGGTGQDAGAAQGHLGQARRRRCPV